MVQILERLQAHYESREMPFGKVYEWHPASVALECDCGEKVTLSATSSSTTTTCSRCGADLSTFVHEIREREGRLPDKLTHPWFYDARERAQQHKHDEATYLEGSRWRYNDITEATQEEEAEGEEISCEQNKRSTRWRRWSSRGRRGSSPRELENRSSRRWRPSLRPRPVGSLKS